MFEKIKIMLGIEDSDKDMLIQIIIDNEKHYIKDYCEIEYNSKLDNILMEMVIFRFRKINSEGLNSEAYSGASFSYSNDLPNNIIKALNKHRKVKVF